MWAQTGVLHRQGQPWCKTDGFYLCPETSIWIQHNPQGRSCMEIIMLGSILDALTLCREEPVTAPGKLDNHP